MQVESIFKRSHEKRQFKLEKITDAILKAMISVDNGNLSDAEHIAAEVNKSLIARAIKIPNYTPNVEEIQDLVEKKLMQSEFLDVAKAYILYRNTKIKKEREIFLKKESLSNHLNILNYMNTFLLLGIPIGFTLNLIFTSDIQDFKPA